ncbi:MAG TPA: hypothetical protein VF810_05155 [Patescibacteria group bacterium]
MKKIIFFLFTLVFSLSVLTTPAFAQEKPKNIVLEQTQTITGDYFAAGDNVNVLGNINGDAYVAGGNVIFNGVVTGDIIAAGGTVTIRGTAQNVRVAGGTINIDGVIAKNVTALGGNVTIGSDAKIAGSIVTGSGTLTLLSPIGKGATLAAGNAILDNKINGNVYASIGQLTLQPKTQIVGNLTYISAQPAQLITGATVSGSLIHNLPPKQPARPINPQKVNQFMSGLLAGLLIFKIIGIVSLLIIGWILLAVAPHFVKRVSDGIVAQPWQSLGLGFVAMIVSPIAFVLLLTTIIGIPLALIFIALFGIAVFISKLFVMFLIGEKIGLSINKNMPLALALFIGAVIYGAIALIPFLGWLFECVALLLGLGSLLTQKKALYTLLRKDKTI